MSRILILYGTTDGHTGKIGAVLAEALRLEGADVDVRNAAARAPASRAEDYAGIIVAASVHISNYQRAVRRWVRANAGGLRAKPSAFLSVCLGVLERNPATDEKLAAILERFLTRTGWRPTITKTVAGALPYTRYNWVKRWVMRRIARQAHADTDTTRDFEYTDWNDLKAFARAFYRLAQAT